MPISRERLPHSRAMDPATRDNLAQPPEAKELAFRDAVEPEGAIDFHAHWWSQGLLDSVSELQGTDGLQARFIPPPAITHADDVFDLHARIALMDEAGIAAQVLSGSNVGHEDPRVAAELRRCNNDGLSEACRSHPGRFRFFASLPLPFVDESLVEADRAHRLFGFAAFVLPTHVHGTALDADGLSPLFEQLNERGHLVSLHPDGFRAQDLLGDWMMDWSIGAPFEDTIAAVRLICSGRLQQFPEIRWIVPHLGGCLPVLVQRMDSMWPAFGKMLGTSAPISSYLGSLNFDTAASSVETLALAATVLSPSAFVLGTDFPFLERDNLQPAVRRVRECSVLGGERSENALRADELLRT